MGHRLFATTLSAAMGLVIGDSDLRVGKRGGQCHDTLGVYCRPRKVKAMLAFPISAGRDYDEVLRLLDALRIFSKKVPGRTNGAPRSTRVERPASPHAGGALYQRGLSTAVQLPPDSFTKRALARTTTARCRLRCTSITGTTLDRLIASRGLSLPKTAVTYGVRPRSDVLHAGGVRRRTGAAPPGQAGCFQRPDCVDRRAASARHCADADTRSASGRIVRAHR